MIRKLLNQDSYEDGIVRIYSVENAALTGRMPVEKLVFKHSLRTQERMVGIRRFYSALQAQIKVDRVIRTPLKPDISTQDVAILDTRDSREAQYRIVQIQYPKDTNPPAMDITLQKINEVYKMDALNIIPEALLTVLDNVGRYFQLKAGYPYAVWAEEGQSDAVLADNQMQEQEIAGTIDYFTKIENDPAVSAIQKALNDREISFRLISVQHEESTGIIHYEWEWKVWLS